MGNSDQFLAARLAASFPSSKIVPAEFRPNTAPYEKLYLQDGKVLEWPGPYTEVSSPICLQEEDGTLKRPVIGRVPAMDEEAAMAGLYAAVRAWDNGRGVWPTMSVAGRIAAVEKFTERMVAVRDEVVRLLMWEIGKSLDDSRKEFDRTVDYIRLTVDALKEMDRNNSRFSVDSEG